MPALARVDDFKVDITTWNLGDNPRPPGNFSMGSTLMGGPQFTDAFGARRAPSPWQLVEKYKSLIFAMVARNADAVTRIPLRLYMDGSRAQGGKPSRHADPIRALRSVARKLARDGKVSPSAVDQVYEIRNHPALDLIDRPDPYGYFNRTKLISLITRCCDVVGGAYLMPDWDGWQYMRGQDRPNRFPEYLWVLYSQFVQPIRYPNSPLVSWFQYFNSRIAFPFVLWFRQNHSLRDPYGAGYSPTYAGDQYATQEDRFIAIYDQVLGLGPRPSLIASAKDPLQPPGDAERKRLEQDMIRKHAGGMAGNILVNTGGWEFTPVSYSPADMAGKEVSEYDRDMIASIFGIPPTYFTTDTNLANLQAADQQHARNGVEPRCKAISETLTFWIKEYDPRLFFAFDDVIPEDELLKAQIDDIRLKNFSITIDEANEELKYSKKTWGAEPWMPGTMVQPSMAKEQHEMGLESQKAVNEQTKNSTGNEDMPASEQFKAKQKSESKKPERNMQAMIDRALDRLEMELTSVQ